MAWATASYAFWLLHIIHKVFQQYFIIMSFHGVIIQWGKIKLTLFLVSGRNKRTANRRFSR